MRGPASDAAPRRAEAGFTMIEIMVSLLLTAIAILGILALYMSSSRSGGYARHTTEATVLAEDEIEFLRTQGAAAPYTLSETGINERGVTPGIYNRSTTETVSANYADITVTVTWIDDGVQHQVSLAARRGL